MLCHFIPAEASQEAIRVTIDKDSNIRFESSVPNDQLVVLHSPGNLKSTRNQKDFNTFSSFCLRLFLARCQN